jgi:hypothetical protein
MMMTIDMTAQLAPIVWGMIGLLAVSGLALLGSYRPARRTQRPAVTNATPFGRSQAPAAA